jgi:hypothetical protein
MSVDNLLMSVQVLAIYTGIEFERSVGWPGEGYSSRREEENLYI